MLTVEFNEVIKYLNYRITCYYRTHIIENYAIHDILNANPHIEN